MNLQQYAPSPTGWIDPFGLDIIQNAKNGIQRAADFIAKLRKKSNGKIQCECYLRDKDEKFVKDPITGERRRVDVAEIKGGKAQTYEITSETASKSAQMEKEARILKEGGKFIRDRTNGTLVPVNGPSQIIRLP